MLNFYRTVTLMFSSKDALKLSPLLDVIDVLHSVMLPLLLFPGIIPRMHVFTILHWGLLFLHAWPKKAIFLLIIWARSSCGVNVLWKGMGEFVYDFCKQKLIAYITLIFFLHAGKRQTRGMN